MAHVRRFQSRYYDLTYVPRLRLIAADNFTEYECGDPLNKDRGLQRAIIKSPHKPACG